MRHLRHQLANALMMAFYDKEARTEVITDASLSVLEVYSCKISREWREQVHLQAKAQVMSSVDTDGKEAVAVVWACERFHLYLSGLQSFNLSPTVKLWKLSMVLVLNHGPELRDSVSDALQVHSASCTFRPEHSWLPKSFDKDTSFTSWWCNRRVLQNGSG